MILWRNYFVLFFIPTQDFPHFYPVKTQHPSDAPSCGMSKVVHKWVMYIYYLGQMQHFRTKILILATALTYDERQPSNCVNRTFWRIQKFQKSRSKVFCLPVYLLIFRHKFDCCDAAINTLLTRTISLYKHRNGLV